jgi:hypothetical protein
LGIAASWAEAPLGSWKGIGIQNAGFEATDANGTDAIWKCIDFAITQPATTSFNATHFSDTGTDTGFFPLRNGIYYALYGWADTFAYTLTPPENVRYTGPSISGGTDRFCRNYHSGSSGGTPYLVETGIMLLAGGGEFYVPDACPDTPSFWCNETAGTFQYANFYFPASLATLPLTSSNISSPADLYGDYLGVRLLSYAAVSAGGAAACRAYPVFQLVRLHIGPDGFVYNATGSVFEGIDGVEYSLSPMVTESSRWELSGSRASLHDAGGSCVGFDVESGYLAQYGWFDPAAAADAAGSSVLHCNDLPLFSCAEDHVNFVSYFWKVGDVASA